MRTEPDPAWNSDPDVHAESLKYQTVVRAFQMTSIAYQTFEHAIQDAVDLLKQFDAIKRQPLPPEAEVLKRASLVMALAALETYIEDRIIEAADVVVGPHHGTSLLGNFYVTSLHTDLKYFHTPSTDRVKTLFDKYLHIDVTAGWIWNHYDPVRARSELNKIAKKRGDIAHRSSRPVAGKPTPHAVTREELRKHIQFVKDLVRATDAFLAERL